MVEQFGHEQRIPLDGWKQLRAILRTTEPDSKFNLIQYWQDRYGNGPSIVKEIRREGQRILQAGTNVHVQPDKRKGTSVKVWISSATRITQSRSAYLFWVTASWLKQTIQIKLDEEQRKEETNGTTT